jgi:hypothetical protein
MQVLWPLMLLSTILLWSWHLQVIYSMRIETSACQSLCSVQTHLVYHTWASASVSSFIKAVTPKQGCYCLCSGFHSPWVVALGQTWIAKATCVCIICSEDDTGLPRVSLILDHLWTSQYYWCQLAKVSPIPMEQTQRLPEAQGFCGQSQGYKWLCQTWCGSHYWLNQSYNQRWTSASTSVPNCGTAQKTGSQAQEGFNFLIKTFVK